MFFSNLFIPLETEVLGVLTYWGSRPDDIEKFNKNKYRLRQDFVTEFIKISHTKTQIDLIQSQLTLAETNGQDAKKESREAKCLAILAILVSLFLGISDIFKDNNIDHLPTKIEDSINSLPLKLKETNQTLDSLVFLYKENTRFKKRKE